MNHLNILLSFLMVVFIMLNLYYGLVGLILDGTGLLLVCIILFSLSVTIPLSINYVVAPPSAPRETHHSSPKPGLRLKDSSECRVMGLF